MHITITVAIDYPTTLESLTRWSTRLFAMFYTCGITGSICLAAAIMLAIAGQWWPAAGLFALTLLLGAVMSALEPLIAEIDTRRHTATQNQHPAQHLQQADQA